MRNTSINLGKRFFCTWKSVEFDHIHRPWIISDICMSSLKINRVTARQILFQTVSVFTYTHCQKLPIDMIQVIDTILAFLKKGRLTDIRRCFAWKKKQHFRSGEKLRIFFCLSEPSSHVFKMTLVEEKATKCIWLIWRSGIKNK